MKRAFVVLILALASGLVSTIPASATIGFGQQVKLRNDPGPFHMKYSSFQNGIGACSDCGHPENTPGGKMTVYPRTYKLVESNKQWDYYLVDVTVSVSGQSGARDSGFLDATVQSIGSVNDATSSSGHSQTAQSCHTYPITISGGWGPLSVGTTVAHFSTCVNSTISRKGISAGKSYHVSNFNGVNNVTFQRFVRVKAGSHPKFKVTLLRPTDKCVSTLLPSGVEYNCFNLSAKRHWVIGTRG
jgi:hypothetical protein